MLRALCSLLVLAAFPLDGQRYWKDTLYPFFYYTSIDGFWFGGHYGVYSPVLAWERPERYNAAVSVDASHSTEGSYRAILLADAPAWWDGWRAAASLAAIRLNRLGYYGLGNDTPFTQDSVYSANPYYYAVSRRSVQARATVQRRIVGALRALAGVSYEHVNYRPLPGGNVFKADLGSGALDSTHVRFSDFVGRVGLVFDTRDNEVDPHRGVFLEAIVAGGEGYSRRTGQARAYVQPLEPLTVAARIAVEAMPGDPPLAAMTEMESSERPFVALGGYYSLRGFYEGRFAGPGKLLGGVEARYALLWAPSILELKLVAFYDVGRVFARDEDLRLTTAGLHHAGGAEVALRVGRNTLLFAVSYSGSTEETVAAHDAAVDRGSFSSAWPGCYASTLDAVVHAAN